MNPVYNILGFKMRLKWAETHHGYYGIALMVWSAGWLLPGIFGAIVFLIGLYLFLDDVYQHHRQVEDPKYHSPVHVFIYDVLHLYDNPVFRWLNKMLDKLFGLFKKG